MHFKPFLFTLTAILGLIFSFQQPVEAAKNKVLCKVDSKNQKEYQHFNHKIQLQLSDALGFPILGSEFWVTLEVIKDRSLVTLKLPTINFNTGQVSTNDPYYPSGEINLGIPPAGGYVYTASGFLPEGLRPNDAVPPSIVAASNNGLSPVFSFTQDPATLPTPPAGYIVQITNAGELQIQCAGTFGNIIPTGPQILMPCTIQYPVSKRQKICKNVKISTGATNITGFTNEGDQGDGFRDSHVNDAFNGVVAFSWTDNSMVADQTNGTMNAMVAVGKVTKKGKLKVRKPVQLTDLAPIDQAWDTAVAINRTNPKNIVVSWNYITESQLTPYRAVSFDGGLTWPYNGPMNILPPGYPSDAGDCRGVSADKFGNIWYGVSTLFDESGNLFDQPYFAVSADGGITFEFVYEAPTPPADTSYDYPQYCFGGDGLGNYGLWFQVSIYSQIPATGDAYPNVGFIPITGLGTFGTPTFTALQGLTNAQLESDLTASADGRLWLHWGPQIGGQGPNASPYNYVQPSTVTFKSPGAIDLNYAGPWDFNVGNFSSVQYFGHFFPAPDPITTTTSYFYFGVNVQSIIYDDNRQALYALVNPQFPTYSENMRIYFAISRDNGQTWSLPIDVSNTNFANRGYQSMALDPITGHLLFGWYDGRHDPSYKSVEYYGAVMPSKTLDKLVNKIPLSNPLYVLPSAALSPFNPG